MVNQNRRPNISMSDEEIATFLLEQRTGTMATIGPQGLPHLIAIWYAVVEGEVWIETKAKSQKIVNLRRDNRIGFMIETGLSYATLRGVSLEGRALISDNPDDLWRVGVSVYERYSAPYHEDARPTVEALVHKRVAVRIDVEKKRSWDHRKMGLNDAPPSGSTAEFLHRP
jgi:PPOX class probable F420-dependent enzyme